MEHEHDRCCAGSAVVLKKELRELIVCAMLLIAVWLITARISMPELVKAALFTLLYLAAGHETLRDAAVKLIHGELLEEDFLMSAASIGALIIGEYPEAAAVMLFYRLGEAFEGYAAEKSRSSISALSSLRPDKACVLRGGVKIELSPSEVKVGETIFVAPGERIPLDGVIIDGESTLDTSALTGESLPRTAGAGASVASGCINLTGLISIRTTSELADSTVSRILRLAESSAELKSKREGLITRFARVYTPAVVAAALILALVPPIFLGHFSEWLRRALIFLVVSCPCALVVSVPLSFFGGIGGASKKGILIKGSCFLEALSEADTVAMDKTGTVTEGSFSVSGAEPVGVGYNELIMLAAAAESFSCHPIAQSLRKAAKQLPDESEIKNVRELAGRGVYAEVCGRKILVGSRRLMESEHIAYTAAEGHSTAVYVAEDGVYRGCITIDDRVKNGARAAVAELKALGVRRTVMLTGDAKDIGCAVADSLGVDSVRCELLPEDKVSAVEELLREKTDGALIFVGDGVNDAPVLSRADVGVAMGALGSDAAVEAADIVIMDDNIAKLPLAIRAAKRTVRIAKENIVFALAVKFAIMLLGAFGIADMWFAVFADVGVLMLAVLNALRTLNIPEAEKK